MNIILTEVKIRDMLMAS